MRAFRGPSEMTSAGRKCAALFVSIMIELSSEHLNMPQRRVAYGAHSDGLRLPGSREQKRDSQRGRGPCATVSKDVWSVRSRAEESTAAASHCTQRGLNQAQHDGQRARWRVRECVIAEERSLIIQIRRTDIKLGEWRSRRTGEWQRGLRDD